MHIGKVIGTVVATRKFQNLKGIRLLLVQPLDFYLKERDDILVMTDMVQCAYGQIIFYVESREASLMIEGERSFAPVDHAIVGQIDAINYKPPKENTEYIKNKYNIKFKNHNEKTIKKSR